MKNIFKLNSKITLLFFLFFNSFTSGAVIPEFWVKQYGTEMFDLSSGICIYNSSYIYLCGYTEGQFPGNLNYGNGDYFVCRMSTSGVINWIKQSGSTGTDCSNGLAVDNDGNICITGDTEGSIDGNLQAGYSDIFITKYSSKGNIIWTDQFGSTGPDSGANIVIDSSGNYYVTGYVSGPAGSSEYKGGFDIFLAKYDKDGKRQWIKTSGTDKDDESIGLAVDSSGNIYICGFTYSALPENQYYGKEDIFLMKFKADGTIEWIRQFGTEERDFSYSIAVDSRNFVYICGYTHGSLDGITQVTSADCFLAKYDSFGNRIFLKQFGTDGFDVAASVTVDSRGVYVTGWTFGSYEGYINSGLEDIFVVKFDFNGNMSDRAFQLGTDTPEWGLDIISDNQDNLFITGATLGTLEEGKFSGNFDFYLLKYPSDFTPPQPVENLTATPVAGAKIRLDWLKSVSPDTKIYNIYYSSEGYSIDYNVVRGEVLHPGETWTSPVLVAGLTYYFSVRAEDFSGNEEKNTVVVSAIPFNDCYGVKAKIKIPHAGKKISGNRVTVMAEIICGDKSNVRDVLFQYKMSGSTHWQDIIPANNNHPNPDRTFPYFIHWDVTSFDEGFYDLRAVATDIYGITDPEPSFITVIIDNHQCDIVENCSGESITVSYSIDTRRENILFVTENDKDAFTIIDLPEGIIQPAFTDIIIKINPEDTNSILKAGAFKTLDMKLDNKIKPIGEYRKFAFSTGESNFNKDVNIVIPYNDTEGDGLVDGCGYPEKYLTAFYYNPVSLKWERDFAVNLDKENNNVTVITRHFSVYGLFAVFSADIENIKVYPNPYRPQKGHTFIKFENLPYQADISVYEITGELVFEKKDITTGEFIWSPVANSKGNILGSGIYFYIIKTPDNKKISDKFVIIR